MRDDRRWYENAATAEQRRMMEGLHITGSDLERKYWVALGLYGVLGVLVWFTMGEGKVLVYGRLVELRLVPLIVIGGFALRTVLARQAERIRRQGEDGKNSS
jgi:hypothetical protein